MTNKVVRDGLTLAGLGCLAASLWFCPALCWLFGGVGLVVAAVAWQRYEAVKIKGRTR